jgi:galactose mutarotase-like enzyme
VTLRAGEYTAVFLPELGMLGASLEHRGTELLSLHGGTKAFREGHTTGLPLLAPWANRLSRRRFRVGRVEVDLRRAHVHVDGNGLPIHGTMVGPLAWEVARRTPRRLVARYRYVHPAFPFPHELEVDARLGEDGLLVETTLRPTGRRRVPVSFGWHPYFTLPGSRRSWLLRLPARRHLELDGRGIPSGDSAQEPAEEEPLGSRTFDDLYALGRDRRLALVSGARRLEIRFGPGYPFAQVYAPPGKRFVALEPMTAPTDALVSGSAPLVSPGDRFSAAFTIRAQT